MRPRCVQLLYSPESAAKSPRNLYCVLPSNQASNWTTVKRTRRQPQAMHLQQTRNQHHCNSNQADLAHPWRTRRQTWNPANEKRVKSVTTRRHPHPSPTGGRPHHLQEFLRARRRHNSTITQIEARATPAHFHHPYFANRMQHRPQKRHTTTCDQLGSANPTYQNPLCIDLMPAMSGQD